MTDMDPVAVMGDHRKYVAEEGDYCSKCYSMPWPCVPYRLAEALKAEQSKVLRVGRLVGSWRMGLRDRIDADDITAALADQPEQS